MITEAPAAKTLSVSVVLHNSDLDLLNATLDSLAQSVREARRKALLGAVAVKLRDNASDSEYRTRLQALVQRRAPAWVQIMDVSLDLADDNPGFGGGHNLAQMRQADYRLILNPDVVLESDALSLGIRFLDEATTVAALNPHCIRPDGTREYLCKRYPGLWVLLLRGFGGRTLRRRFDRLMHRYEYRDLPDTPTAVTLLSGACLLCRGSAFTAVAGFDEGYFMYFEDFDLSLRLTNQGELHYLPTMKIQHHGGFAARKGWRHRRWFIVSAFRFFRRNGWRAPRAARQC